MAKRKLRQIRLQSKRKQIRKPPRERSGMAAATAAPPPPQPPDLNKQDIVAKLIPLSVPSARDAQKNAEKAIENVLAAIVHVLSEGDVSIADFGELRAGKDTKTGDIHVSFTPDGKLKQAVEARLNTRS